MTVAMPEDKDENEAENHAAHREQALKNIIRHLELIKLIGAGKYGKVFLARHKPIHKYYALKVMVISHVVESGLEHHVHKERQLTMSVRHPFLIKLWATGHDDLHLYMMFELASGGDLFTRLKTQPDCRFDQLTAKFYAAQVLLAVSYLHSLTIAFRDLKPENLLIDKRGHVKVSDFGFAKQLVNGRTYTLCGTPDYMAPEIILSKGYGFGVDWWSYGVLTFEMVTGTMPFHNEGDLMKQYEAIVKGEITTWPDHVDAPCKDFISRLLCPDRTQRLGLLREAADGIKNHEWFSDINFTQLLAKEINPPFVPKLKGGGDTSYFTEVHLDIAEAGKTRQQDSKAADRFQDF